jgi:ParB family chromosome partitioning protein
MKARAVHNRPRETIPLRSVDLDDRTFLITFSPDLRPLKDSLARSGMIHPPLVQAVSPPDRYRVVSGWKRILAARELGWDRIAVRLAGAEEDDVKLFLLGLDENLGTRTLNVVEKSLALDKLRNQFGLAEEEVLRRYLPGLELGSNPKTLALYLAIAGLEQEILHGLAAGELSLGTAHRLTAFSSKEGLAFFHLVRRLRPGKNLQRELLTLLMDIGRREKTAIDLLLAEGELASLAADEEIPAPQRTAEIRKALLGRRYPQFSEAMERYEQLRRKFRLPPRVSLSAPPFFEGGDWRLSITFRSREELSRAHETLHQLIDHPLLDRLLNFPPEKDEER